MPTNNDIKIKQRYLPQWDYRGLTVVMSNPSRFDQADLLSANGGHFFTETCLRQGIGITRWHCDLRLKECKEPLLPNTKCVILLGESALKSWTGTTNSLNAQRGSPLIINGIPHIASFNPQDATDFKNHEKSFNAHLQQDNTSSSSDDKDVEDESEASQKDYGKTSRKNYQFWLKADTLKCGRILENNGKLPNRPYEPTYHIYPNSDKIIQLLTQTKSADLLIDIETDSNLNIVCFAFSFNYTDIYVVPLVDHLYNPAYSNIHRILQALSIALCSNTVIAHNGHTFDFFLFVWRYRLPIGRKLWDTLVAQHRIYPEAEKSLGHCISYWTYESFHKDEGGHGYGNREQAEKMWLYCGKDVFTMGLVKKAQDAYALTKPGLPQSLNQAMRSIYPYLLSSLQGLPFDQDILLAVSNENDKLMEQYIRISKLLVGEDVLKLVRKSSKKSMLGSSNQLIRYFHDMLGYDVVARSKDSGEPSLGAKAMYKLKLKYNNPVIDLVLAYRQVQKETGALKFIPYATITN